MLPFATQERKNILGEIVNEEMKLNKYGEIIKNEWLKTPQIRKYIDSDEFQIMPNHLHAIIIINNFVGAYCHTPANRKKTTNTGLCNKPLQKPWYQSPPIGLGAIIRGFKSVTAKQINQLRNTPQQPVWQRGFYEHIIRNETELAKIQEYINLNPLMWPKDENNLEKPKIKIMKKSKSAFNPCKSLSNPRKSKIILLTAIFSFFLTLIIMPKPTPVFSQSFSLSLSPPVVEVMMQPGKKATYAFQLKNNSSSPITLIPKVIPFQASDEQGQVKYPQEKTPWLGQDYFSFLNAGFEINQPFLLPGEEEIQLVLKISLPQNAPEGDYYQSLILEQVSVNTTNQTQTQALGQIGSHILLTVSSSGKPKKEAQIVEFSSPSLLFGKILDSFDTLKLKLRVRNSGQAFFKPFGEMIIFDNNGEKITSLSLRPDNILKSITREIYCQEGPCHITNVNFLGRYQAQVQFGADENGPITKQSFTFWVLPIKLTLGLVFGLLLALFIWWGYRKRK